jgi:hypothetical protein
VNWNFLGQSRELWLVFVSLEDKFSLRRREKNMSDCNLVQYKSAAYS